MASHNEANPRSVRGDVRSVRERLEEAETLAVQVERLLYNMSRDVSDSEIIRVRLARAHTLSLLDQLSELVGTRPSPYGPSVRNGSAVDADDESRGASRVRRAPLPWR